jgi:CubicO group peptidase (beta-lactamase class C family)
MRARGTAFAIVLAALLAAAPAHAAKSCPEPEGSWERATPAEAGMDGAKLQAAVDYGTTQESFAIRVYRHGCLVAEDRGAAANRNATFESWSMAKSVTSLIFGRAMQLGEIGPDDTVGGLVPEADGAHGEITMRHLLTMTSGLAWNGFRDYNIFTMPDRVRDALTLQVVHRPGQYFEYAQSAVALLAEAIGRSTGEDVQAFAQRELMDPLGIPAGSWSWERDRAGHVQGFYGVKMRADDFGRLGELMRRGGRWRGRRILSRRYMNEAIRPSATNGCYGWLHWLNAGAPCIGPRIEERPVEETRDFPDLPADFYTFAGLFGQRVAVFPSQGLLVVRTGHDPNLVFAGGQDWEHELYKRILDSVADQRIVPPGDPPRGGGADHPDPDSGFQDALRHPEEYGKGVVQDPLPPAGPQRARALRIWLAARRATPGGTILIGVACPGAWPGGRRDCEGTLTMTGAPRSVRYDVAPGEEAVLRVRLSRRALRSLRRTRTARFNVVATNVDSGGGTPSRTPVDVRRPRSR